MPDICIYVCIHTHTHTHTYIYIYIYGNKKANRWFFIAKLIVCSTCFGHRYAHHQELKSIIQVVAACGTPSTTGSNHLYNTLELLMMGIVVPETCWANNKVCNKEPSVASSWPFYFHILMTMHSQTHIKFVCVCVYIYIYIYIYIYMYVCICIQPHLHMACTIQIVAEFLYPKYRVIVSSASCLLSAICF